MDDEVIPEKSNNGKFWKMNELSSFWETLDFYNSNGLANAITCHYFVTLAFPLSSFPTLQFFSLIKLFVFHAIVNTDSPPLLTDLKFDVIWFVPNKIENSHLYFCQQNFPLGLFRTRQCWQEKSTTIVTKYNKFW